MVQDGIVCMRLVGSTSNSYEIPVNRLNGADYRICLVALPCTHSRPRSELPMTRLQHPVFTRRTAIQAGAIGLLGLGMNHCRVFAKPQSAKTCIYIFLSGGL